MKTTPEIRDMHWVNDPSITITKAPQIYGAIPHFSLMRVGQGKPVYDEIMDSLLPRLKPRDKGKDGVDGE